MKQAYIRRLGLLMVLLMLSTAVLSIPTAAAADEGGRVPYQFSLDNLNGEKATGTMIGVIRDMHLSLGEPLLAQGWLATPEGVVRYEYLWLPVGGGSAEWKTVKQSLIHERDDLAAAGIPHQSGHGSAGFNLTIDPPEDLAEGVYDVYIRAIDGMGVPCDMVALLNLRYGDPDVDNGQSRIISFPRIQREGDRSVVGDPTFKNGNLTLSGEQMVRLGDLNLASFELVRITYRTTMKGVSVGDGRQPVLGLKSSGKHSYGAAGERYNMTDSLVYASVDPDKGEGTLEINLQSVDYNGEVWLSGYLGGEITITEMEFIYNGYTTDRVAAKMYLSGDLIDGYFRGYNRTAAKAVTDPVLGEVLRLEVSEATNDPYVHFDAGSLLRDYDILLNADEYKYMVLLYRADTANNHGSMSLYLCSGPITGATEACNQGGRFEPDGKWHYLLVDLTQKENWGGIINGWRFDYISGDSDPGDGVEFATVQFFRTYAAAKKAASVDPLSNTPHKSGDPAVFRDLCEENNTQQEDFVIPPEDTYVVTEPDTEAPTEPPADTASPESKLPAEDTSAPSEMDTDTKPSGRGCSSAVASLLFMFPPVAVLPLLKRRKLHER